MNKLNIYYHVVPTNDGCVILCQDRNTSKLYLHNKAADKTPNELIFSSEQAAEEWMELMGLTKDCFKVEKFGTTDIIEEFSDLSRDINSRLTVLGYNFDVGM